MSKFAPHGGRSSNQPRATANTVCQKCLGRGHFIYECKGARPYLTRPSRTQQLENPRLLAKLKEGQSSVEVPEEFKKPAGTANRILEAKEKERSKEEKGKGQEKEKKSSSHKKRKTKRSRSSSSSGSSDSDSDSSSSSSSSSSSLSSDSDSESSSGSESGSSRSRERDRKRRIPRRRSESVSDAPSGRKP